MKDKRGIALVTALVISLAISISIGILIYMITSGFHITKNYKSSVADFYECDGVNNIEVLDVITLNVSDITKPKILKQSSSSIPGSSNEIYNSAIKYEFYKPAIIPGTSLNIFNNYYYSVQTTKGTVTIKTWVSKIGPRM